MKRIWHPYWLWEDWKTGMWRKVSSSDRPKLLQIAIDFTGDADKYGEAMMEVVEKWHFACEQNLTDTSTNKLAWIGHAATALAVGCPEDVTRQAWGNLSVEQQCKANAKAQMALDYWIEHHEKQNSQLCLDLESEGV